VRLEASADSLCFYKNFEFFAVGSGEGTLVTYDATKLTQRNSFTLDGYVTKILTNDDRFHLISSTDNGSIYIHDYRKAE
jgi:WD40 repeat protein